MCRWAAYIGRKVFISEIVSKPSHSLIVQSHHADEGKTEINADGFGLSWYNERPEPGHYRDVFPAWSDPNLRSVCHQVRSSLFFAHVRASTGSATSRNNCHPFCVDHISFMMNGQVADFERIRKSADMLIADAQYVHRRGETDSEAMFLIAMGMGLADDPKQAMLKTVKALEQLSTVKDAVRMTVVLSDGKKIYTVRYASIGQPPSLYYRWEDDCAGWAIVSEPFEERGEDWVSISANSFCTFDGKNVALSEFDS